MSWGFFLFILHAFTDFGLISISILNICQASNPHTHFWASHRQAALPFELGGTHSKKKKKKK